jgi:hypothetical protein
MPVVFGSFAATGPWTIVVAADGGLRALKWNDEDRTMVSPSPVLPLNAPLRGQGGPTAFPNGLVAYVASGRATFIDADTFTLFNRDPTQMFRDATVAGGLRQMYFVVRTGMLLQVDSNGVVRKQRPLEADSIAFPALSGNHVHVATTAGLRTFSLALEDVAAVDLPLAGHSSPAIDSNGSVYVAARSALFAFLNR